MNNTNRSCLLPVSVMRHTVTAHYYILNYVSLHIHNITWHVGIFIETRWMKLWWCLTFFMHLWNILAHSDTGERQGGSGKAHSTHPTAQEEAEGPGWTRALRVWWIRWLHRAETWLHGGIQHGHCWWGDWDEFCCAEYPAGKCEGCYKSYLFIVVTCPISLFSVSLAEVPIAQRP